MSRSNASSVFAASASLLASALLVLSACTEAPSAPNERPSPAAPLFVQAQAPTTITFVSDPTWLPASQNVCLSPTIPSNCPAGATVYGSGTSGWGASLSSIPGAFWIWSAGITAQTAPAFPAESFFSKSFSLGGLPIGGTISVAADDYAQVVVNGAIVGEIGSRTNVTLAGAAQSSLTTFDIGPYLVTGINLVTVHGANGNFGCGAGEYSCNPAGVVFGGSLIFRVDPATKDDCKDVGWETYGFRNQGQCVRFIETGEDGR
jgi:hypothetical protein